MSRLLKIEKYGYVSKKRDRYSKLKQGDKIIFWWRKGYPGMYHYKCDTLSKTEYGCEGIGETLKEAIDDCIGWIEHFDKGNKLCV